MPFFSIILPTYNRAQFLPKAIDSVIAQTFVDWELIIVDDGSTDNTKEVVAAYKDPRILYIYQENQERSAARNNGIAKSNGEYICFLDSDDYYLSEKLENLFRVISTNSSKQIVWYDGLLFENSATFCEGKIPSIKPEETIFEFLLQNPIFSQQICCPKEILHKQQYNPSIRIGEDTELWLRLGKDVAFRAINSFQTVILEHEDRSVNLKKYNAAKEQLRQLELIFKLYNKNQISQKVRTKMLSNCYFNSARHYMYNQKIIMSNFWVIRSIITDIRNSQNKHRLYCFINLIKFKIPLEYNSDREINKK
jgi:glycosyltransferase involved in cell wall biosynthesis